MSLEAITKVLKGDGYPRNSIRLNYDESSESFTSLLILDNILDQLVDINGIMQLYVPDIGDDISRTAEILTIMVSDNNALLTDIRDQLNMNVETGLQDEEKEREDKSFQNDLLKSIDRIGEGITGKDKEGADVDNEGGFFKGLLSGLFGAIGGAVSFSLPKLIAGVSGPFKAFTSLFGKIFGPSGLILGTIGKLFGKLAFLAKFLGPLAVIISGIVGIASALKELASGGDVSESIAAGLASIIDFFTFGILSKDSIQENLVGPVRSTIEFMQTAFKTVKDFMESTIIPFIHEKIIPTLKNIFTAVSSFFSESVIPFFTETIIPWWNDFVDDLLVLYFTHLYEIVERVFKIISLYVQTIWEIAKPILRGLFEFFKTTVIPFIKNYIFPAVKTIMDVFYGTIKWVLDKVLDALEFYITSGILDAQINFIVSAVNLIIDSFNFSRGIISTLWNSLMTAGESILGLISSAVRLVAPVVAPIVGQQAIEDVQNSLNTQKTALMAAKIDIGEQKISNIDFKSDIANSDLANSIRNPKDINDAEQTDSVKSKISGGNTNVNTNVNNTNIINNGGGRGGGGYSPIDTRMNDSTFKRFNDLGMSSPFA